VQLCTENDDVLLTTRAGKCIRFAVTDIRVFKGRESTGVRGVRLASGDEVVSLALLAMATPASRKRAPICARPRPRDGRPKAKPSPKTRKRLPMT